MKCMLPSIQALLTELTQTCRKQGRPSQVEAFLNAHSCYVISRLREIKLGNSDIQHVLDTFTNPKLDVSKCVRSYHHVAAVEKEVIPVLVCPLIHLSHHYSMLTKLQETYKQKLSTGEDFFYKKATDIAALVLSDPSCEEDFAYEWSYNNGHIQHPWHTDGWLDLLAHFWHFALNGYKSDIRVDVLH